MADKNVQNYLVSVLGIFVFIILTLLGSFFFGETIWIKIAIPLGIGVVIVIVVSWLRKLTN